MAAVTEAEASTEVASVAADFAEADLAVLVFMGHMPTADTAILTAMAATTTTAAAI